MSLKTKWIVSRKPPLEAKKVSKPCNNTPQPPELSKLFIFLYYPSVVFSHSNRKQIKTTLLMEDSLNLQETYTILFHSTSAV